MQTEDQKLNEAAEAEAAAAAAAATQNEAEAAASAGPAGEAPAAEETAPAGQEEFSGLDEVVEEDEDEGADEEGAAEKAAEEHSASARDPQTEIAILRGQLEQVGRMAQEDHERMLRSVAEAENVRRRAEGDIERERKYAMERFVKGIIPVFDSLDQALTLSDRSNPATKATLDGVESTINLMLKELSNFGVECINPQGEKFDPNLHQALSAVPSSDVAPNHIIAVMQKGFILNGRVVRPAMVMVAKAADQH